MAEYVAAAAAVVGAAVAAYGTYESGQQASKAAKYNAKVADQQAELATRAGAQAEADSRERSRRLMATQRAALGTSGVTTEGTPLLTLLDTAQQAEMDALRARYSGEVRSQGFASEAVLLRSRAGQARTAGAIGAGATLLTGAGNVGNDYFYGRRNPRNPRIPIEE